MKNRAAKFLLGLLALSFSAPSVQALPETASALEQSLARDYAGDASLYAERNRASFRRMACQGRADLLEVLLHAGLDLGSLRPEDHDEAVACAQREARLEMLRLLLSGGMLAEIESRWPANPPLKRAVEADNYDIIRLLIDQGAALFDSDPQLKFALTRDGQLLLAARYAMIQGRLETLRAFNDAGLGDILADASSSALVSHIIGTAHAYSSSPEMNEIIILTLTPQGDHAPPVLLGTDPEWFDSPDSAAHADEGDSLRIQSERYVAVRQHQGLAR